MDTYCVSLHSGTKQERGILAYHTHLGMKGGTNETDTSGLSVYDLPLITSARFRHIKCCTYIPFVPAHKERTCCTCFKKHKKEGVDQYEQEDGINSTYM